MPVISQTASQLNRRDEQPNIDLAEKIVRSKNEKAVSEIVQHLQDKNQNIASDCIKVLDEVAKRNSVLVAGYYKEIIALLSHKNNRLIWGAMAVIDEITKEKPSEIFKNLPAILDAADKGSVITNDHAVGILVQLCGNKKTADSAWPLLFERLQKAPDNQFAMYAEKTASVPVIPDKKKFTVILHARIKSLPKESQQKRVEKILKKIS